MTRFLGVAVDPIEGATLLNPQMTGGRIARTSGVSLVLAQSAVPASVTGTTSETVLATIPIPAGAMGVNGVLRARAKFSYSASANQKTMRLRLGGSELARGTENGGATNTNLPVLWDVTNRGSLASQIGVPIFSPGIALAGTQAYLTATVDMSQAQNLTITGQLANAADTITLEAYTVELLNP